MLGIIRGGKLILGLTNPILVQKFRFFALLYVYYIYYFSASKDCCKIALLTFSLYYFNTFDSFFLLFDTTFYPSS